jgi:hypothetical protein
MGLVRKLRTWALDCHLKLGQCGGIEPGTHVVSAHSGLCQKWVTGHLVGVGEMVGELHTVGCLKWTRHCRSESWRPVAEGVVRIELWRRRRLSCWLEGQIGSLKVHEFSFMTAQVSLTPHLGARPWAASAQCKWLLKLRLVLNLLSGSLVNCEAGCFPLFLFFFFGTIGVWS